MYAEAWAEDLADTERGTIHCVEDRTAAAAENHTADSRFGYDLEKVENAEASERPY